MPSELNIRSLLCKERDEAEIAMPVWAACLMELGMSVAHQFPVESNTDETRTVVLCLPRIEYAALFLACGAVLGVATAREEHYSDLFVQAAKYVGESISVIYKRNWVQKLMNGSRKTHCETITLLGVLKGINHKTGELVIKTGTKANSCSIILAKNVISLMRMDSDLNLDRKQSERKKKEAQDLHDLRMRLFLNFDSVAGIWLVTNQKPVVSIIGAKKRISEESALSVAADNRFFVQIRDVVRLQNPGSNIAHALLESQRAPSGECNIAVIEAGRGLVDTLQSIKSPIRIVLLDRNSLAYEEIADSVLTLYNTRKNDCDIELPSFSSSIQAIAFNT